LTLIGRSFGGMVVKLILDAGGDHIAKIWRAITVATPFYGYGGQLHRFFKGEPYLNWYYGTSRMAQIISSMLGVYTLQFLDYDTYRRDKGLLEKEPDYPLRDYPSRDAQSRAPADPCNPTQQANSFRYPTADWFKWAELEHARGIYRQVAVPLTDPAVRQKFHNFRGVRYRNGTLIKDTVNSQTWGWVQRDFDPDRSGSPITDDPGGPGDDTIPAWSARLASTPADNVRTLKGTINHMFLMDADETLIELGKLVGSKLTTQVQIRGALGTGQTDAASPQKTLEFLRDLHGVVRHERAARAYRAHFTRQQLR